MIIRAYVALCNRVYRNSQQLNSSKSGGVIWWLFIAFFAWGLYMATKDHAWGRALKSWGG